MIQVHGVSLNTTKILNNVCRDGLEEELHTCSNRQHHSLEIRLFHDFHLQLYDLEPSCASDTTLYIVYSAWLQNFQESCKVLAAQPRPIISRAPPTCRIYAASYLRKTGLCRGLCGLLCKVTYCTGRVLANTRSWM